MNLKFDDVANEKQKGILKHIDYLLNMMRESMDLISCQYKLGQDDLKTLYTGLKDIRGSFYGDVIENAEEKMIAKEIPVPLLRIDTFKDHVEVFENGEKIRCRGIWYNASTDEMPEVTIVKNVGNETGVCAWRTDR